MGSNSLEIGGIYGQALGLEISACISYRLPWMVHGKIRGKALDSQIRQWKTHL